MILIIQTHKLESMGGYSDTRLRLFIFGFLCLGLIMTPFLGMLASLITVSIFGIFTAIKINNYQQYNPESILRHQQAMDQMYNNAARANYYESRLKSYEKKIIPKKHKSHKTLAKINKRTTLKLAIAR